MPYFVPNRLHQTQNRRGYMHPLSSLTQQFVDLASQASGPVMDMGCAYGNAVIEALASGTNTVIACDMEAKHLAALQERVAATPWAPRLITQKGLFPDEYQFSQNSLAAIHTSHLLPYLTGDEVTRGLAKYFDWLAPGGKLFIVCYSMHILELNNEKFRKEYARRLKAGVKWPGYFEDFDAYSLLPADPLDVQDAPSPFPTALHIFDLPILEAALRQCGFVIEMASYLDGKTNGAIQETWHDGREHLGIIARKP